MAKRQAAVKRGPAAKRSRLQEQQQAPPAAESGEPDPGLAPAQEQAVEAAPQPQTQATRDLFVFGDGEFGQLGRGEDVVSAARPLPSLAGTKVKQVACGGMHTAALAEDGTVHTTGVNDEGALGRRTAGAAWENSTSGGTIGDQYEWVAVDFPAEAGPLVQLSAGDSHTVALDSKGQLFAWGTFRGDAGVFGFSPGVRIALLPTRVYTPGSVKEQVQKISSGADHVLALRNDGVVLSWGVGMVGQLGRVGTRMLDPEAVQLTPGTIPFTRNRAKAAHITDIATGSYSSFAVTAKGNVFAWGLNNYGQLGVSSKKPSMTPHYVERLSNKDVVEVAGGQHHTLARTKDGKLLSLGRATYGRLGRLGNGIDTEGDEGYGEPGEVQGLEGASVHSMAAGLAVSGCIAGAQHKVYLWGFGTNNQLAKGDEDDGDELTPLQLKETKRLQHRPILQLDFGGQHAALLAGGSQNSS